MIPSQWIDATDLNGWANRLDSQSTLPQLLRFLVHATAKDVQEVRFPSGDSVQMGGWDGVVVAPTGNAFVPRGLSVWELGTNRDVKTKANKDYKKRSEKPLDVNPRETTFVFVTPRRWGGKDKWIEEKNAEGIWTEVRAYDADDIEQWLELAPAVHSWLAQILGKWSNELQDIGSFWSEWSDVTSPSLRPKIHLLGRDEETDRLASWLGKDPSKLTIHASSQEEAIAFFSAWLQDKSEGERMAYLARCVLVRSEAEWRRLSAIEEPLILIPTFAPIKAIPQKHYVLVPIGNEVNPPSDCIRLTRLSSQNFRDSLSDMSFPAEKTYALSRKARRSLPVLRLLLATNPEVHTPLWATPKHARSLMPALLVGAWDEKKETDQEVIHLLAQKSYAEVVESLSRWLYVSDAPIRRIGNVWQVVCPDVAWYLLGRYVLPSDIEQFSELVQLVLGEEDPKYELPADNQYAASLFEKTLSCSSHLRDGLAETLIMLSNVETSTQSYGSASMQSKVDQIVSNLLNTETGSLLWASLSPLLPKLAEAAPDILLSTLTEVSSNDDSVILSLFQESQFGSSPHNHLLWALEALAWNPEYLSRVTLVLARISRLDPGGRTLNRPFNSLKCIFQLIKPQTTAPADSRFKVLDMLVSREPSVAWSLLLNLMPIRTGTISTPAYRPRKRNWADSYDSTITYAEYWRSVDELVQRILLAVGSSISRLCSVINSLDALPPDTRDKVIGFIEAIDAVSISDRDLASVWNTLRKLVYKHKEYPDAQWAMPLEAVEQLERLHQKFEPKDIVTKHLPLFSNAPCILEYIDLDWKERGKALEQRRTEAVSDIYLTFGVYKLMDMVSTVKRTDFLGTAIARVDSLEDTCELDLLEFSLGQKESSLQQFATYYVLSRFRKLGWDWASSLVSLFNDEKWTGEKIVCFLQGLPFSSRSWELLSLFDEETQRRYWKTVQPMFFQIDEREVAIRQLLMVERPWSALELVATRAEGSESMPTNPELVIEVLEKAATTKYEDDAAYEKNQAMGHDIGYRIELAFKTLDKSTDVSKEDIARLELIYLSALTHSHRQPKVLYQQLSNDPELFASVVGLFYKPDEVHEDVCSSETVTALAIKAYELLEAWHQVPGLSNGVLDLVQLNDWIDRVRASCQEQGVLDNADSTIGSMLTRTPQDQDGVWPSKDIAEIIERLSSEDIELGVIIGTYKRRAVYSKAIGEGGVQERKLAETYENHAKLFVDSYPRTASTLQKIARSYISDAHREDIRAEFVD